MADAQPDAGQDSSPSIVSSAGADPGSLDALFKALPSPEKITGAQKDIGSALEEKIGAEGALIKSQQKKDDLYLRKMRQQFSEESASRQDLRPWDPSTMAPPPTSLWEKFGSPGFVFAMLASSFSAMPMNSALAGGAAAMNAINEGDMEGYNRAFNVWKDNTDLLIKRHGMEHAELEDIGKIWDKDTAAGRVKLEALLTKYDDKRKLAMLHAGMDKDIWDAADAQHKAVSDIIANYGPMLEQHAMLNLVNQDPDYKSGDPKKMIQAIERAKFTIAQGMMDIDTTPSATGPTGGEPKAEAKPYEEAFGVKSSLNWVTRKAQDIFQGALSKNQQERARAVDDLNNIRNSAISALSFGLEGEQRLKQVQERVSGLFPKIEHLTTGPGEAETNLKALRDYIAQTMNDDMRIVLNPQFEKKDQEKARLRLMKEKGVVQQLDAVMDQILQRSSGESGPWQKHQ